MGLKMKNFNIMGFNIKRGNCLKRGLALFADLRWGLAKKKGSWCFWGGVDTLVHTMGSSLCVHPPCWAWHSDHIGFRIIKPTNLIWLQGQICSNLTKYQTRGNSKIWWFFSQTEINSTETVVELPTNCRCSLNDYQRCHPQINFTARDQGLNRSTCSSQSAQRLECDEKHVSQDFVKNAVDIAKKIHRFLDRQWSM